MDERERKIFDEAKLISEKGQRGIKEEFLLGGLWTEKSRYIELKNNPNLVGSYGELLFKDEYDYDISAKARGIDVPDLNLDVKTATRANRSVTFTFNFHRNTARYYFCYLFFPDMIKKVCIPHSALPYLKPRSPFTGDYEKDQEIVRGLGTHGFSISGTCRNNTTYKKTIELFTFDGDFDNLNGIESNIPSLETFFE